MDSEVAAVSFAAPPRTRSTTVRLNDLTKRYGTQLAVDALSLTIEPGTMLALLGPSGCGKTTCLRMIAGLVQPTSGEIFIDGKRITGTPVHRRNIGMLFQNYALFPHMTVAENVAFGLEARRISRAETASTTARTSFIRSLSMCRRPAVSTMTVSRPVNRASRRPALATSTGLRRSPGENTGTPIWRPRVASWETAAGRDSALDPAASR